MPASLQKRYQRHFCSEQVFAGPRVDRQQPRGCRVVSTGGFDEAGYVVFGVVEMESDRTAMRSKRLWWR